MNTWWPRASGACKDCAPSARGRMAALAGQRRRYATHQSGNLGVSMKALSISSIVAALLLASPAQAEERSDLTRATDLYVMTEHGVLLYCALGGAFFDLRNLLADVPVDTVASNSTDDTSKYKMRLFGPELDVWVSVAPNSLAIGDIDLPLASHEYAQIHNGIQSRVKFGPADQYLNRSLQEAQRTCGS